VFITAGPMMMMPFNCSRRNNYKAVWMMMSFICSYRNKNQDSSSIYTLRKVRTIRGCLEGAGGGGQWRTCAERDDKPRPVCER
jgi:hypothetical protein